MDVHSIVFKVNNSPSVEGLFKYSPNQDDSYMVSH